MGQGLLPPPQRRWWLFLRVADRIKRFGPSRTVGEYSALFPNGGLTANAPQAPGVFDFIYFSAVTISTTGFGDIVPASHSARFLAMCEIAVWVSYTVSVFALVLADTSSRSKKRTS